MSVALMSDLMWGLGVQFQVDVALSVLVCILHLDEKVTGVGSVLDKSKYTLREID